MKLKYLIISLIVLTGCISEEANNEITIETKQNSEKTTTIEYPTTPSFRIDSTYKLSPCTDINSIRLPIFSDSTYNGDGFTFYGKWLGNKKNYILADCSIIDSSTITRLTTWERDVIIDGEIRVGSSLLDLFAYTDDLYYQQYMTYDDPHFFKTIKGIKVEYRFKENHGYILPNEITTDLPVKVRDMDSLNDFLAVEGTKLKIEKITISKHCN